MDKQIIDLFVRLDIFKPLGILKPDDVINTKYTTVYIDSEYVKYYGESGEFSEDELDEYLLEIIHAYIPNSKGINIKIERELV